MYYAAFLQLYDKRCVMIGGGTVATRRSLELLRAGANITVISPTLTPALSDARQQGLLQHLARAYQPGDLDGAHLVFATTDHSDVNEAVSREAARLGILCNRADLSQACDFIVPSVVNAGPIQVAISSAGVSPTLTKRLREAFEADLQLGGNEFMTLLRGLPEKLSRNGD